MSNFFDMSNLPGMGGGGGNSSSSSAAAAGASPATLGLLANSEDSKPGTQFDPQKAYGFGAAGAGTPGDQSGGSKFNQMRLQQMGMGGGT